MIGKLRSVVLDCRDPLQLATFYAGVLGGTLEKEDDTLGATRVADVLEDNLFRVFRDPAGHTFDEVVRDRGENEIVLRLAASPHPASDVRHLTIMAAGLAAKRAAVDRAPS